MGSFRIDCGAAFRRHGGCQLREFIFEDLGLLGHQLFQVPPLCLAINFVGFSFLRLVVDDFASGLGLARQFSLSVQALLLFFEQRCGTNGPGQRVKRRRRSFYGNGGVFLCRARHNSLRRIDFRHLSGALQSLTGRSHSPAQLGDKFVGRRRPILQLLLQSVTDDRFNLRRHLNALRRQRRHVKRQMLFHDRRD